MAVRKFNPVSVSSKFQICGLPVRVDSYKGCSFGCRYCFSNYRVVMGGGGAEQVADVGQVERVLSGKGSCTLLGRLVAMGITWHFGGMSDPFQPLETARHVTRNIVDVTNRYGTSLLFSTKSDTVHDVDIRPDLHSFQMSVTNVDDRRDIEPGVPCIDSRVELFRYLKRNGFRVGIRVQPFIPGISTTEIVDVFRDADNFTIEGIKVVPQSDDAKKFVFDEMRMRRMDFVQRGLLTLTPQVRLAAYGDMLESLKRRGIPFSVSDNDLRTIGTNACCCGDRLVRKASGFDVTGLIRKYGTGYTLDDARREFSPVADCVCNGLFASNRVKGCRTVEDFYVERFDRKTAPASPKYQVHSVEARMPG